MNKLIIYTLNALRKAYAKFFKVNHLLKPDCEQNPDVASKIIYDLLMDDKPCMIARFGAFELNTVLNYLGVKQQNKDKWQYIKGESIQWWWNIKTLGYLNTNAGFFPPIIEKVEKFCELMLEDMKEVDLLGSWLPEEKYFNDNLKNVQKISLILLEPYLSNNPWTRCLKGKRVLIVHPFAEQIEEQYLKRTLLFSNPEVLPEFKLQTIAAVQSIGNDNNGFDDWFEALEWMKNEIDKREFDICLIGCGAYGFPLAAHIKRTGKKVVHLGGALQLLFGIKGNRWEAKDYALRWNLPQDKYISMFNEYWVKPSNNLKPEIANKVEGACYW